MSDKQDTPNIIFDRVPSMTCSMCGCAIDVSEVEPFTKIACPDCGDEEPVPGKLGQFLLLELLGTGGMGGVYKARDMALSRLVGIKVMLSSVGKDAKFIETFKREAQAAANLNHPNVAQIYSFGQEKGQPYIVMELVSGKHFDLMVEGEKYLNQGLVMKVGLDIALGLQAADEIGLIHGDIKPENILLDSKMNAKLVDFGIASFSHQGGQEGIWGTPYYIAPEKIKKQKADARSDIYSLGATLYHAITKKPPFDGNTPIEVVKARLKGPPPPMTKYRKGVNERVQQIISRMLEMEPARRYPNYSSLISDLRKSVDELGTSSAKIKLNKKVIISKRTTSDPKLSETSSAPESHTTSTASGKKKIIAASAKKRKTIKSQRPEVTPNSAANAVARRNVQTGGRNQHPPKKKSNRGRSVAFSIIGILLLVSGIFFFIQDRREKARIALIEYSTLMDYRKKAVDGYDKIKKNADKMATLSIQAQNHKTKVIESVEICTGVPIVAPPKPTQPDEPEPDSAPAPAPPAVKKTPASKPTSTGLPPGMPTREQLDARRAREAAMVAGKAEPKEEPDNKQAGGEEDGSTEEPAFEAPPPPSNQPRITVLARKIIDIADEMEMNAGLLEEMRVRSLENKRRVDASSFTYEAAPAINQIFEDLNTADSIETNTTTQAKMLYEMVDEATAIRKQKDKEIAARKKAEEEEAARIAAEEEAARKAAEYAELVKREMAAAETEQRNGETSIVQHQFERALDAVNAVVPNYESKEGKAAINALREKYQRLVDLKQFLIDNINKNPYTWGYGSGRSARDISAADKTGITVTGISGTIGWDKIGVSQMMQIITHYLADRRMKIRTQGEMNLNTAIYCHGIAQGNQAALDAAQKYVDTAAQLCEDLKSKASELGL